MRLFTLAWKGLKPIEKEGGDYHRQFIRECLEIK